MPGQALTISGLGLGSIQSGGYGAADEVVVKTRRAARNDASRTSSPRLMQAHKTGHRGDYRTYEIDVTRRTTCVVQVR